MPRNVAGLFRHRKRGRERGASSADSDSGRFAKAMDKGVYAAGLLSQLMTLPQVIKIFAEKDASGVSALTWGSYILVCAFWMFYGVAHKERAIVITYALLVAMDALVTVGALMYG